MMSSNLISHVCETRKLVMAILHWKQRLLCDKKDFMDMWKRIEPLFCQSIDHSVRKKKKKLHTATVIFYRLSVSKKATWNEY